jgi:hypothetical protein
MEDVLVLVRQPVFDAGRHPVGLAPDYVVPENPPIGLHGDGNPSRYHEQLLWLEPATVGRQHAIRISLSGQGLMGSPGH